MRKALRFALAVFLAASMPSFSGCAEFFSSSRAKTSFESYTSKDFPFEHRAAVAADIVERLQSGYPPGQTELYLYISGQGENALADSVEALLRARGFIILPKPENNALTLSWRVDKLDDDGSWYLLVVLSSGYRFSRIYRFTGNALVPESLSQGIL